MHRQPLERLKLGWSATLLLLLLGVGVGCKENACKDLICVNGEQEDCSCICDTYWEGIHCDTLSRQKFLGSNWYNSRTCPGGGTLLVTMITADAANEGALQLRNVHQNGDTVFANVKGDSLQVPIQVHGLEYIEGAGFYSSGSITLQYKTIQTGGQETACVALFTQ